MVALLRIGTPAIRPALQRAVGDEDWEVRVYAAEALKLARDNKGPRTGEGRSGTSLLSPPDRHVHARAFVASSGTRFSTVARTSIPRAQWTLQPLQRAQGTSCKDHPCST